MLKLLTFAFVLFAVTPPVSAQQANPTRDEPVIVTVGEGVVTAAPDRAWITVTAESRAANPREAQRRNVDAMKPVLDRLSAAGIPSDAVRTTEYDLQPDWDFSDNRRVLRGYVARNTVDVRVDSVDRVGDLLELVVSAGATSVGGVRFDLKDRDRLEREAIRLAVADARERAVAAAAGAGATIDGIVRIEEQAAGIPPQPVMYRVAAAEQRGGDVPVAAGQMEVRARVTLTARLK